MGKFKLHCGVLKIDKYFIGLCITLLISGLLLLTPSIHGTDGVFNFVFLRSLVEDGDLDFANDFHEFDKRKNYPYKFADFPKDPTTHRYANRYGIGSSILWSPFYLSIRAFQKMLHPEKEFDSFGTPAEFAVSLGSFVYCSIGLLLLYLFIREHFSSAVAVYSVLFMFLASPLAFYTYFHPSMSHANAFFLVTLWLVIYLRLPSIDSRFSIFRWIVLGIVTALVSMTRFQDALILVVLFFGEIYFWVRKEDKKLFSRKGLVAYLCFLVAFIIAFSPQLFVWRYLYGSLFSGPVPYLEYKEFNLLYPRHLFQVLFSPWHGFFYWHPFLAVGLLGLLLGLIKPPTLKAKNLSLPQTCLILLVLFLLEVYLTGCWQVWHAGASFGQRLLISTLPAIAFGTALLCSFATRPVHLLLLALLIILAVLWNANLAYKYGKAYIPRQAPVYWSQMLNPEKQK
ncbi:glycosyltransferase family 39 protein [Candidatus Sumerlaeota bacterium]|nr:glycosyltransferase family 39 protein [Candidatus Sumerlaeota bacterium]